MGKSEQVKFLHRRLESLPRGERITFNTPFLVDLERNQRMKRKRRELDLKVGRPQRPADEISGFILEFDKLSRIPPAERRATLPESLVATLSQWQNLKHTMEDPSIATAEYEGRKIGIQLFDQAQEMEAFAVLPKIVKWLDKIITDTYQNFTMPSKKDREESGSVYSWSHTQRLDYNFFTGMRSEIVGMVKDSKKARQAVPENCRGGFEHLVVSSDVPKKVPAPAPTTAALQAQRQVDDQGKIIPPIFGGVGIRHPGIQHTTTVSAAETLVQGRQQGEFRQSLICVPHDPRPATITGPATSQTGDGLILGRGGEAPATQGVRSNTSSKPVNNAACGIQVQDQRRITPSTAPDLLQRALNCPVNTTDWVKMLQHAIEEDAATQPYRSSPRKQDPSDCPFAITPAEQKKESSSKYGVEDPFMEEFVDLNKSAAPAREEMNHANTVYKNTSPRDPIFPFLDSPNVPRTNNAVPARRGSDSTVLSGTVDGIFSDAGSASVATSPEADMDEVDMINTGHVELTRSNL